MFAVGILALILDSKSINKNIIFMKKSVETRKISFGNRCDGDERNCKNYEIIFVT